MPARFSVLASGSSGNAAFLEADGYGLLIDAGLGPRHLALRLGHVGASWKKVHGVILTHTHSDHWKDRTLGQLVQNKIPLYCHPLHYSVLQQYGSQFAELQKAGLVRHFSEGVPLALSPSMVCTPIQVPHDSMPTFGFRLDGPANLFEPAWSLGYASDLGTAPTELLQAFQDVHLLALEFNHDEEMEKKSNRPRYLIDRVLGRLGHLSNRQAAEVVQTIAQTASANLRDVVLLHLSRDCNRANLAQKAADEALMKHPHAVRVTIASQEHATRIIPLDNAVVPKVPRTPT